jgi:pyruvate dehydrogenase (quinone)
MKIDFANCVVLSRSIDMAKTVADLLVERLIDWGIETIFGFPGDGVNGIFEALRTHEEKLKFI